MKDKCIVAWIVLIGIILFSSDFAFAQSEQQSEGGSLQLEEIIVTARKREELLEDVPLTISVFTADNIREADLRNLADVSNLTPGFRFENQGLQEPGRYNTRLKFRGLTTYQLSPSFAAGALFIDGIYVLNGGTSVSLMDIERIEVIKGPQAAYFGRNTFGGAVNLITRDPNMEEFTGEAQLRVTDRSNNEVSALVTGPIIPEVLSVSLNARYYDKQGHYRATNGDRTGNEETTAYNAVVKWQTTDNLSFKVRYGYSEDDDGPPTGALISGWLYDTCTGKTIDTANGPVSPTKFICGQVPYAPGIPGQPGTGEISQNTRLPVGFPVLGQSRDLDEVLTDANTNLRGVPDVNEIGMKRETERLSIFGEYAFDNGYSINFNYGDNDQRANWIRDNDLSDRQLWYSRDPQLMHDESYEIRLSSPSDQRLRWLVGYNKYTQEFTSSMGGGELVTSCLATTQSPPSNNYPADCTGGAPGIVNFYLVNRFQNSDTTDVQGVFASLDFDITDSLTTIIEGRWQQDELAKGAGLFNPGAPLLQKSFNDFLPRVIVRWQPSDTTNLWASYSKGQIPGDFNTDIINADARELAQYLEQDPDVVPVLEAETLKAWEVGLKQAFWDGRGHLNLAFYHYTWESLKGQGIFNLNESCRPFEIGVAAECDPANGIVAGDPKQLPGPDGELEPLSIARRILLPGSATINGMEFEGWFRFTEDLQGQIGVAYIDSEYDDLRLNDLVAIVPGYTEMAGNYTSQQPKWSGNASLSWNFNLFGQDSYLGGDYIYNGKSYVSEDNLAFIDDYSLVNARLGMILNNEWTLEVFVTNLFDEEAWASGARKFDNSIPLQFPTLASFMSVLVSPLDQREFGARINVRF